MDERPIIRVSQSAVEVAVSLNGQMEVSTVTPEGEVVVQAVSQQVQIPIVPPSDTNVNLNPVETVEVNMQPGPSVVVDMQLGNRSTVVGDPDATSFTSSPTTPGSGDGDVGDMVLNSTTLILYEKTSPTAWTNRGQLVPSLPS